MPSSMPKLETVVLIPESTRKGKAGQPSRGASDAILEALPAGPRETLVSLRAEVMKESPHGWVDSSALLPAYLRYQGNMYRHIPAEAWEARAAGVEVVILSGLRGFVASRDPIPFYEHSMAEPMAPFGKFNRWWHDHGLPEILAAYLCAVRPVTVVDLLSLEYRDAVAGFADGLGGIALKTIDFPGMGRGSQPLRGEKVAEILRTGQL